MLRAMPPPYRYDDMKWRDRNYGKSPFDPDYRDDYDADADKEAYDEACEEKEQQKRGE